MFDRLTERLDDAFRKLRGQGRLSDRDLDNSLREIRRALLEADVNFDVARSFLKRVREQAVGREVLRSLTPGQQVIKIVHDELVSLLGGDSFPLAQAERPPTVILLVGLQGCGKTTAAAKLASHLQGRNRPPFLVGADVYRPAAFDQLRTPRRRALGAGVRRSLRRKRGSGGDLPAGSGKGAVRQPQRRNPRYRRASRHRRRDDG